MGINYTFTLRVGYSLEQDVVHRVFEKTTPGEFHMEDRYDSKTGQKIGRVKVWDKQPETTFVIDGQEYDDDMDAITSALARFLGCDVAVSGSYPTGEFSYDFTFPTRNKSKTIDYGKIDLCNPSMYFSDVVAMEKELWDLKYKMDKLGLNPGNPKVFISSSIG